MPRLSLKHVLQFAILFLSIFAHAQTSSPLQLLVQQSREQGIGFSPVKPFSTTILADANAQKLAPQAQYLTLDVAQTAKVAAQMPQAITFSVPFRGSIVKAELVRAQLLTEDFSVLTSASNGQPVATDEAAHYRGVLAGDPSSVAAISIFPDGEVMGVFSSKKMGGGNLVLGRLDVPDNTERYVIYDDSHLSSGNPAVCHTPEKSDLKIIEDAGSSPEVSGCVRVFLEADYALFVNKTSVQATVNYLTGLFNQVATLYQNEQISTKLSQVFVWVSQDSYSTTSSSTALDQFKAFRTSFNGDLAHLVGIGGSNLGGIGYVDVLCVPGYNYSYSDVNTSYSAVPTYSWSVEVVTHELGHNLGSNHTHWCGWTGGALDNCYTTEGGCAAGPAPTSGGTIMSYCHLNGTGINFANGFGSQPGNLIRNYVSSAACLAASCTTNTCTAPTALTVTNITGNSAVLSWTAVTGATSYTARYRAVGAASWTTVTNAISPLTLTGLPSNDEIEATVATVCSSTSSDYLAGVIFKTTTSVTNCNAPSGLTATNITTSSATVSWGAVSGASSYVLEYKLAAATTWNTPITVTGTTYNFTNLLSNTSYNYRVRTNCTGGTSTFAQTASFTTLATPTCLAPTNLTATNITQTSATLAWTAGTGATAYLLEYKPLNAITWSTPISVVGTTYSLTGLNAGTGYEYRVKADCSVATSGYSATATFITLAPVCDSPQDLEAVNITPSAATITWTAAPGALSYVLKYKLMGANDWLPSISVNGTMHTLTGLDANTAYEYCVTTVCSGNVSDNSNTFFFLTEAVVGGLCATPSGLAAANITQTSATLTWAAVTDALSYELQYKSIADTAWSAPINVMGTTYTLSGLTMVTTYYYRVQTLCNDDASNFSSTESFTTLAPAPCDAPIGLAAANITTTSATVSWTAASGATSYVLEYKTASATTWNLPITVNGTSYALTNLMASTIYNFRLKTVCLDGVSGYSSVAVFTTAAPPCGAPTGLTATNIASTSATLSWTAASGASSYVLEYKTSAATTWNAPITVSGTTYSLTGLSAGTAYNYRVKTICTGTVSAYSTVASFTTLVQACGAPTGLTATNITSTSATVSWTAVAGAVSYRLEYKKTSASSWGTPITVSSGTSYSLTSLVASTAYSYRVKTNCANGTSSYSTTGTFTTLALPTCDTPTGLTATNITATSATVSWTAVAGAVSYRLEYKKTSASSWGTPITVSSGTSYSLTSLVASTAYSYRVKTNCVGNSSAYSTTGTFTTLAPTTCNVPSTPTVTGITSTAATVTWPAATGAVTYNLQYKSGSGNGGTWITIANIAATTYQLTNLLPNTSYSVKIRSNCANGIVSNYSNAKSFNTPSNFGNGGNTRDDANTDERTSNEDTDDDPASAIEFDAKEGITLAPNPVVAHLAVNLKFSEETTARIEVLDLMGRPLRREALTIREGNVVFELNDLPKGIYLLRVTEGKEIRWTRRFNKV